ncbi:MAG: DUF1761 domain-containing protein [Bacteroidota bacterium]
MEQPKINFPAVLVAALIQFVLGWGWYMAFISIWMEGTGITMESMQGMSGGESAMAYGGSFVAYALLYYVMAHFVGYTKSTSAKQGALTGLWCWVGFVGTTLFVTYSYSMKPFSLWLVDAGYWLVSMLIGGVLLAVWRKKDKAA